MLLSKIWSHGYMDHFLIYIRPIVFSDWLKHWSSKTPLSKHLHLRCHVISQVFLNLNPKHSCEGQLEETLAWSSALLTLHHRHPFLQFPPNTGEGSTEGGWAELPPLIPPAPHKEHANYSCLIVSTKSIVHKPRGSTFPVCSPSSPEQRVVQESEEPVKQWNQDQRAGLQPATGLMHPPSTRQPSTTSLGKTESGIAKQKWGDLSMWNLERHNCSWRVMKEREQSTKSQAHNSPHWVPR